MVAEYYLLIVFWVLTGALLVFFVPRHRYREAIVIFLFKQVITWLFGLVTVEAKLIEYPVRIFQIATKSSFTFEYFVYPALCILFVLYYPAEKGTVRKMFHYFAYCSVITLLEVILERYTELIKYIRWTWFFTWLSLALTFFISRLYYKWFFKDKAKGS